jgi:uncharacterized protein YodC (DUF2158 family)
MLTATLDPSSTFETSSSSSAVPFRVGDVVMLKSGGPRMTTTYVGPVAFSEGDWVVCQWFDEYGELRQDIFEPERVRLEPRSIPAGSVLHMQQFFRAA